MSWFDSFNVLHGNPKTVVDNDRDSEKSKSVAEIIDDIEKYNEKKKLKEKEEERAVVERLLQLMKPEEEVISELKTEIAIQVAEFKTEVAIEVPNAVIHIDAGELKSVSDINNDESIAMNDLEDEKHEEGLANSPRKNTHTATDTNTVAEPALEQESTLPSEPTTNDTPTDTEKIQTPDSLVTNPENTIKETPSSENQPTAALIPRAED